MPDGVGGRDEGERGHDDLVAGAHARYVQREGQGGRAAGRRDGGGGPDARRERFLELRTRGPCESQPEAMASATAAASPPVRCGRVIGISVMSVAASAAGADRARSARHQSTSRRRPSSRSTSASKPEALARERRVGEPPRNLVDGPLGPYSIGTSEPITSISSRASSSRLVSTPLATLKTTSLESVVGGEQVRAGDVVDVDEVHRLRAVAEDQRRAACLDPLHPAHEHLGVDAVDVHPRAVDVEVAKRDVVEVRASRGSCAAGPR